MGEKKQGKQTQCTITTLHALLLAAQKKMVKKKLLTISFGQLGMCTKYTHATDNFCFALFLHVRAYKVSKLVTRKPEVDRA